MAAAAGPSKGRDGAGNGGMTKSTGAAFVAALALSLSAPGLCAARAADEVAAWSARLDWPEDCRPEAMPEPIALSALPGGDRLLLATCRLYAYQAGYRAWRLAGAEAAPLPLLFPFLVEHDGQATLAWRPELVGLADVEGDRLTLLTKARGIGDCGEAIAWDLSEPLPVATAYRSRPDCPDRPVEADTDPATWPALPEAWLAGHRPADRSRAAVEALARLSAQAPELAWLAGSLVEADLDCDGVREPWALGLDAYDTPPSVSLLAGGEAPAAGPIPLDPGRQIGLCGPDLATRLENGGGCPTLVIEDGLCDALRLTYEPAAGLWRAERN
jgi:hypothetical protein